MKQFLESYKRIAYQFLFLITFYFISRVVFTLLNLNYFEGLTFLGFFKISVAALRFDLSALFAINSLYILILFFPWPRIKSPSFHNRLTTFFVVINTIAFLFEISDWAYFPFNQKRATADVLDMLLRPSDFTFQLPQLLLNYWYVPLAVTFFTLGLVFINAKIIRSTAINIPSSFGNRFVSFIIVVVIGIVGIRGGVQYVPIGIRNAIQVTDNRFVPILLNTPFSIISSIANQSLEELHFFEDADLKRQINTTKHFGKKTFNKKNLVIIVLESFSKEFTGIGGMKSYTPFLDSLMNKSFVCHNAFANAYRSADAIPAIISGIPSIQQEPFTTSRYGVNRITSIPGLLGTKGYSSAFYHGGSNGTMSFDLFAKNAGFQKYVGRSEYANENDFDGNWGIWDEPFLQFCNRDISENLKEPFVATVFTLSSHPPYTVPQKLQDYLPKGELPIHQPIAYTDYALGRFFAAAEQQAWYQNTLFVIVADHCSPLSQDEYYNFHQGRFAIPIVYFSPSDTSLVGKTDLLTQQIDIMPSVMDYLGFSDSFFAFGNSIFSPCPNRFTIQQWSGNLLWTAENYFLRCNYDIPEGLFDVNDKLCKNNLLLRKDIAQNATINQLKAFRQTYHQAMIHNKLWVK